jgi:hypothetical protein
MAEWSGCGEWHPSPESEPQVDRWLAGRIPTLPMAGGAKTGAIGGIARLAQPQCLDRTGPPCSSNTLSARPIAASGDPGAQKPRVPGGFPGAHASPGFPLTLPAAIRARQITDEGVRAGRPTSGCFIPAQWPRGVASRSSPVGSRAHCQRALSRSAGLAARQTCLIEQITGPAPCHPYGAALQPHQGVECAAIATGSSCLNQLAAGTELKHSAGGLVIVDFYLFSNWIRSYILSLCCGN